MAQIISLPTPYADGPEMRLNSTTAGAQHSPDIMVLADGRQIITWYSSSQSGRYGVLQDRDGTVLASEFLASNGSGLIVPGGDGYARFRVSSWELEVQFFQADGSVDGEPVKIQIGPFPPPDFLSIVAPTVSPLADGGFLVTWMVWEDHMGPRNTFGMLVDADGSQRSDIFAGSVAQTDMTALADGQILETWTDRSAGGGVFMRLRDADGDPLGEAALVGDYVFDDPSVAFPEVTVLPDGGFVLAWRSSYFNPVTHIQAFDAQGVAEGAAFDARSPAITVLQGGGFVVASTAASGAQISAQIYDSDSNAVGDPLTLPGRSLTALEDGGFVVVWTAPDGSLSGVFAQVFSGEGTALGAAFRVNSHSQGNQNAFVVTALEGGAFEVAWVSDGQDGSGTGIYAQVFGRNDIPAGSVEIAGDAVLGQILEADVSSITDGDGISAGSWQFQWYRDGVAIAGQTSATYALALEDLFTQISVRARYTDGHGTVELLHSDAVAPVAGGPVVATRLGDGTTGEDGSGAVVLMRLATRPVSDVMLSFSVSDPSEAVVETANLVFDAENWDQWQEVHIRGLDDYRDDGAVVFDLLTAVASSDPAYDGLVVAPVGLSNLDDGQDSPVIWTGGPGADLRRGLNGSDRLYGAGGNDTLTGGIGADSLYGGDGDDLLRGQDGQDRLYGGTDDDDLYGGGSGDRLYGNGGDDTLRGQAGDDALYGGVDDDRLLGEDGADELFGGAGQDRLSGGDGQDRLRGGANADLVSGGKGQDSLYGDDGNDTLNGQTGGDTLYGGLGEDRLTGDAGHDELFGGADRDRLSGGTEDDSLYGGLQADTLLGGAGNDALWGGGGRDEFHFGRTSGRDVLHDFVIGSDVVVISGLARGFEGLTILDQGSRAVVLVGTGGTRLTFENVDAQELGVADFLFI